MRAADEPGRACPCSTGERGGQGRGGGACSGTWKWARQGEASGRASRPRASPRSSVPRSPAAVRCGSGAGSGVRRRRRGPRGLRRGAGCSACRAAESWDLTTGMPAAARASRAVSGSSKEVARWQVSTQTPMRCAGERAVSGRRWRRPWSRRCSPARVPGRCGWSGRSVPPGRRGVRRAWSGPRPGPGGAVGVEGGAPGERQGGDGAFGDVVGEQRGEERGPGRWCGRAARARPSPACRRGT